jgi:transcriptional regulator with GAF, ATPase, and Fis domain
MSPDQTEENNFDALLTAIATRLLGEPAEAFDASVDEALSRLVAFLGVERATLRLVDPTDGRLRSSQSVAVPGVAAYPVGVFTEESVPWINSQLHGKRLPVIVSGENDLPPGSRDLQTMRAFNVRSVALFPILAGDRLLGALSFGTSRAEQLWPEPIVHRLRLIGEVFAGALLRREHEARLRSTLAEVEALRQRLQAENEYLREQVSGSEGFEDIVGESPLLRNVLFRIAQVAPTDSTVLVQGETGTGKELVARAIHARSARRDGALVSMNCAALPPTLIESELFGHEKGAFTGAVARKIGRFELADGGTLFLDEVGELPLELQAKLLRVLEEGAFERVGSSTVHRANVRIIAASNRDLAAAAREGRFRADLYYRLLVFPIDLPPLRARKEDIPLLVWYVLDRLAATLGKRIERVPAPAMDRLLRYDWPGNIRELRNVLERAVILSPGPTLVLEPFGDEARTAAGAGAEAGATRTLVDVERDHVLRALERCDWRVRGPGNAAAQLGLNASTLYSRMKKLGIRRAAATPRRPKAG